MDALLAMQKMQEGAEDRQAQINLAMQKMQEGAEDRQAQTNKDAQIMQHIGNFMDVASRPVATQAEIMAGQVPKRGGSLGQGWREAGKGMQEAERQRYSDVLNRFKLQNQAAQTLAKLKQFDVDERSRKLDEDYKRALISKTEAQTRKLGGKDKGKPLDEQYKQALINKVKKQTEQIGKKDLKVGQQTEGQKKVDRKFGDEWAEFDKLGGLSVIQSNLDKLEYAKKILERNVANKPLLGVSGKIMGSIPEGAVPYASQEAADVRDMISEVAQGNLRKVLGGQFAQKEGEAIIRRAFNPKLSEEMNLNRVNRLIEQIKKAAKSKVDAGRYFENNNTLTGYKGPAYHATFDDNGFYGGEGEEESGKSLLFPKAMAEETQEQDVIRSYQGKKYRLMPGKNPKLKSSWEVLP